MQTIRLYELKELGFLVSVEYDIAHYLYENSDSWKRVFAPEVLDAAKSVGVILTTEQRQILEANDVWVDVGSSEGYFGRR
jgi:hypothetical protein